MSKLAVDKFKEDIRFRDKIAHIETIPAKEGSYQKVANLNEKIVKYLDEKNIKLYEHQAESIEKIREDKNIIKYLMNCDFDYVSNIYSNIDGANSYHINKLASKENMNSNPKKQSTGFFIESRWIKEIIVMLFPHGGQTFCRRN